MRGYCNPGQWPSLTSESLWQMPQAWTLIRTHSGSGWGIGRSTISNGQPGRAICAARIFGINNLRWHFIAGLLWHQFIKFFSRKWRIRARMIGWKFEVLVSETVSKQKPKKGKHNYESE